MWSYNSAVQRLQVQGCEFNPPDRQSAGKKAGVWKDKRLGGEAPTLGRNCGSQTFWLLSILEQLLASLDS